MSDDQNTSNEPDRGPDQPAETRDDSAHRLPRTDRDVERGRSTAREVIDEHNQTDETIETDETGERGDDVTR